MDSGYAHRLGLKQWLLRKKTTSHGRLHDHVIVPYKTRSPATAGKANRSLLFLEQRIPMPELFTELRFSVLREFWTQEIRLPLLGGDAPRLG